MIKIESDGEYQNLVVAKTAYFFFLNILAQIIIALKFKYLSIGVKYLQ